MRWMKRTSVFILKSPYTRFKSAFSPYITVIAPINLTSIAPASSGTIDAHSNRVPNDDGD